MIRHTGELRALGMHAVIESHDNSVYQKLAYRNGEDGAAWFLPGVVTPHTSQQVLLPARLLDDGR